MSKRPQWVLAPSKRKPPSRSRLARGFILLKGVAGAPNWVPVGQMFDPADQLMGSLLRRRSVSGARQSYRPDFVPALCGQGEADNLENSIGPAPEPSLRATARRTSDLRRIRRCGVDTLTRATRRPLKHWIRSTNPKLPSCMQVSFASVATIGVSDPTREAPLAPTNTTVALAWPPSRTMPSRLSLLLYCKQSSLQPRSPGFQTAIRAPVRYGPA
ncbi:hypothetical protein Micbo1qcDRAFT_213139 [Microdochium bolleyi]|uniref:Uncharacterized protein n=1 Tax=Microdochium bolleyi TaxID=196109 RepID=A0A136IIK3_9PEZI|nr:hypothetical protein Micbo1qcDRAFT_213139 [Microdochium bolleyi]